MWVQEGRGEGYRERERDWELGIWVILGMLVLPLSRVALPVEMFVARDIHLGFGLRLQDWPAVVAVVRALASFSPVSGVLL